MTTFLKRLLFDDERLRERTLTELVHAFSTGRMVAFVGSMATEAQGYGSWDGLVTEYLKQASAIARLQGDGTAVQRGRCSAELGLRRIEEDLARSTRAVAKTVALSLAREALDQLDDVDPLAPFDAEAVRRLFDLAARPRRGASEARRIALALGAAAISRLAGCRVAGASEHEPATELTLGLSRSSLLGEEVAGLFRRRPPVDDPRSGLPPGARQDPAPSVISSLFRDLRIHRFATLNYDLEIEAELMIEPQDPGAPEDPVARLLDLRRRGLVRSDPAIPTRLSRLLSDGRIVESDVRDRGRPDRLIEFAVGSTMINQRIMHLHGRATDAGSMIVGLRDYDRLYRKNDPARLPFEHGQRVLFGGNPVLFVGTGMSEPELTWTLQDFVSNNPYKRFAPSFLLWLTSKLSCDQEERAAQKWLKRIDFFRKFGVLTVFDEDLAPTATLPPGVPADLHMAHQAAWAKVAARLTYARRVENAKTHRGVSDDERNRLHVELLSYVVPLIGAACSVHDVEQRHWGADWRNLKGRLSRPTKGGRPQTGEGQLITLWCTPNIKSEMDARLDMLFPKNDEPRRSLCVVIAPSGSGKGVLGWTAAKDRNLLPGPVPPGRRLVVNAGYALDSDFLLLAISRFLLKLKGEDWKRGPETSRERQFEHEGAFQLGVGPGCKKALIVINGIERFFTVDGAPLSAELDHLLRRIARPQDDDDVHWLILGSERTELYFRTICEPAVLLFDDICPHRPPGASRARLDLFEGPAGAEEAPVVRSVYFSFLIRQIEAFAARENRVDVATAGDLVVLRAHAMSDARAIGRVVVDAYLTVHALERAAIPKPGLAMEILRALAFIGNPVEAAVLLHVPRVRSLLWRSGSDAKATLAAVLKTLTATGIVLRFERFALYPTDDSGWDRYGLHSSVASELRRRVGVPLTESKLSTSFNMSLYVAQPVDSFVPDAAIHDELGLLIDHLLGAYKDDEQSGVPIDPTGEEAARKAEAAAEDTRRGGPHTGAAMRAALAVIRSYYSTTSLLTVGCDERPVREDRDGVLLEHAERLETLLAAFRKLVLVRGDTARGAGLGPAPLYPEDLIWILNELGVVYLAQGDLYAARRNFDEALRVNAKHVEFGCHSHNWRRITMNQVLVEIERADLSAADLKLRDIEISINMREPHPPPRRMSRFEEIQVRFGSRAHAEQSCFDRTIMHEEILMTALVLGHRGFVHHLRGHLPTAAPLYREAIALLRRLGEHRAFAMFQRLSAQLLNITNPADSRVAVRLAVAASESVRQMDMAYHARNVAAHESWQADASNATSRRNALNQLSEALSYAATMDLHRLRVEAGLYLARLKLASGDYESALDHAADAMSVAARYGLTLRKISLRIETGHILIRRGDPLSGAALIAHAVESAARFGYQRAVEAAQKIRLEENLTH